MVEHAHFCILRSSRTLPPADTANMLVQRRGLEYTRNRTVSVHQCQNSKFEPPMSLPCLRCPQAAVAGPRSWENTGEAPHHQHSSSVLLQRCRKLNVTCQEAFRHRESASPRPEPPENGAAAVQRIDSGGATARHFLLFCHRGLHQPSARILCCWTRFAAATVQAALLLSVQCRQRGCSVARLRTF